MFVSILAAALAATAPATGDAGTQQPVDPASWANVCKPWDEWNKPAPPYRIYGNTYYVGTCGISAILVVGDKGAILIDGGPSDAGKLVAKNIEALGFKLSDVKILLETHEHFDHAGGLAELKRLTGAKMLASPDAAKALEQGGPIPEDPQFEEHGTFPKVAVDGLIRDGEVVRLGNLALQAHATPGHTTGALSWSWKACDGTRCHTVAYVDSLSPVSSDSYRFSDHPAYLATYRKSIATVAKLPCDILLTPHPSQSDMVKRAAIGSMLGGYTCAQRAKDLTKSLDERLAKEAHGR
ncbi:subclass B3 metallo-beta-lactamase [Porphyrobacter algicida]|uniref:Subclass B3 metallo-beta-lactamase n=1 Tax=Qipengyuania algicida TaxID=1836209 RepID=A0A845AJF8_9SPHN|nr:subclass B3 metallo-beta-lactamase [Qipengyuania algicida]MXP28995.1 subclass B3 metallo-beta-lactamase [Qipengyuania algicida]